MSTLFWLRDINFRATNCPTLRHCDMYGLHPFVRIPTKRDEYSFRPRTYPNYWICFHFLFPSVCGTHSCLSFKLLFPLFLCFDTKHCCRQHQFYNFCIQVWLIFSHTTQFALNYYDRCFTHNSLINDKSPIGTLWLKSSETGLKKFRYREYVKKLWSRLQILAKDWTRIL